MQRYAEVAPELAPAGSTCRSRNRKGLVAYVSFSLSFFSITFSFFFTVIITFTISFSLSLSVSFSFFFTFSFLLDLSPYHLLISFSFSVSFFSYSFILSLLTPFYCSFVLYGNRDIDTAGALRLADDIPAIFRSSKMLLYIDETSVHKNFTQKLENNSNVIMIKFNPDELTKDGWTNFTREKYRLIRYLGMDFFRMAKRNETDKDYDFILFRDLDNGINTREIAAVQEFLDSELHFHSMRDSPHHYFPIMGGMWAMKRSAYDRLRPVYATVSTSEFDIAAEMKAYLVQKPPPSGKEKNTDQFFLRDVIYPQAKEFTMTHDPNFCNVDKYPQYATKVSWGFPTRREGRLIACNNWHPNGTALIPPTLPDAAPECRRRPEWRLG